MTSSKFNNQGHPKRLENIDSPFQDEAFFSEEETIYAAKALESRLVGYEDDSPFLQAFADEETPVEQAQWKDSEADYTEQGESKNWEESYETEMADENPKNFIDQSESYVAEQEVSEGLIDDYESYELNEEDENPEELLDESDSYVVEQDEAETLTDWDEAYVSDIEIGNGLNLERSSSEYENEYEITHTVAPRVLTYTTKDVIDQRISVPAQHSLVRLSKNQTTSTDAVRMLQEIKAGRLEGIYCVNWKKAAERSVNLGKNWWTVIPKGEDAVLMMPISTQQNSQPLIAFRRELAPDCGLLKGERRFPPLTSRLDATLMLAWQSYLRFRRGEIGCFPVQGRTDLALDINRITLEEIEKDIPTNVLCEPGSVCIPNVKKQCICQPGRNTCPGCECELPEVCKRKYSTNITNIRRLSFQEMWNLIIQHYYCELSNLCKCSPCYEPIDKLRDIFSPELLIAIFWEETGFRNIPQLNSNCGPAVGFGQVQGLACDESSGKRICTSSIKQACEFCRITPVWTPTEILRDDSKSIQIAGMLLWRLYCTTSQDVQEKKASALRGYAGQPNIERVQKWLRSEELFKEIREKQNRGENVTKAEFIRALNKSAEGINLRDNNNKIIGSKWSASFQNADDPCVFPNGQIPVLSYSCPNMPSETEVYSDEWDTTETSLATKHLSGTNLASLSFPKSSLKPRVLTYTTDDVIDSRISVPAQHSLVRLSKKPNTSAAALGMLKAVKSGQLAGIYCVNWKTSAQRALRLGKNWWTVIPKDEDAILMMAPSSPPGTQPLIAFRRELSPNCGLLKGEKSFSPSPSRLDTALLQAWKSYLLFRRGEIGCFPIQRETFNSFGMNQVDFEEANTDIPSNVVCGPGSVCIPTPVTAMVVRGDMDTQQWVVADPSSLPGTDPLVPQDISPRLTRKLVSVSGSSIKWFGVVVPLDSSGHIVGGAPHLFFTPSPLQGDYYDGAYDQFTTWIGLWDKYTSIIGSQLVVSGAPHILVIPFYKNVQSGKLGTFLTNWREVVSAVITVAIDSIDPLFLRDRFVFDRIFLSSFSNGITMLQNFHTQGNSAASLARMAFDLDGQASGSAWRPSPGVSYRNTPAPRGTNPHGTDWHVGGRFARIRPRYPGTTDHNLCPFLLLHGLKMFGR